MLFHNQLTSAARNLCLDSYLPILFYNCKTTANRLLNITIRPEKISNFAKINGS